MGIIAKLSIDWDKAYRILERLNISMPTAIPGEPLNLEHLRDLAIEVHMKRDKCTEVYQRVSRKEANCKRDVRLAKENLRLQRIANRNDSDVLRCTTKTEKESLIEELVVVSSSRLAILQGRLDEWQAYLSSVDMQLKQLEQSKQILNTLTKLTLADLKLSGQLPDTYHL